jgi:hypothetical protein
MMAIGLTRDEMTNLLHTAFRHQLRGLSMERDVDQIFRIVAEEIAGIIELNNQKVEEAIQQK